MAPHDDLLRALNENIPLHEKLHFAHRVLEGRFPTIERIAVTVHEPETDVIRTLVSSGSTRPLQHYQANLVEMPALFEIVKDQRPRVLRSLEVFGMDAKESAIYVMPMFLNGNFFGFVFFSAASESAFEESTLHYLDVFGHMISLVIISEVAAIRTLLAAVSTARKMSHERDPETGAHLDRMSRYARIIATELAEKHGFSDEYIEHVFMFAPLHDIGKIAVPDNILLKAGKLSPEEFAIMRTHAEKGRELVDNMLRNFGLDGVQHVGLLRNIVHYHHEAMDGSGYPEGLIGAEIPIEARIVAVADIFDALTSKRPYKDAWSNDDAFANLRRLAGHTLDVECVDALLRQRDEIEAIQARFLENEFG